MGFVNNNLAFEVLPELSQEGNSMAVLLTETERISERDHIRRYMIFITICTQTGKLEKM